MGGLRRASRRLPEATGALALIGLLALGAAACGGATGTNASGPTPVTAGKGAPDPTGRGAPTTTTSAVPVASAPGPPLALVATEPPGRPYRIEVPEGWQYEDETVPSDHTTDVWQDPTSPGQRLSVVRSGCAGCVERSVDQPTPDPALVAPTTVVASKQVDPWTFEYEAPTRLPGDLDFGQVSVAHAGSAVTGYARLDVVLPAGDQALAEDVLGSYAPS